jgi:hypothetical protein
MFLDFGPEFKREGMGDIQAGRKRPPPQPYTLTASLSFCYWNIFLFFCQPTTNVVFAETRIKPTEEKARISFYQLYDS